MFNTVVTACLIFVTPVTLLVERDFKHLRITNLERKNRHDAQELLHYGPVCIFRRVRKIAKSDD